MADKQDNSRQGDQFDNDSTEAAPLRVSPSPPSPFFLTLPLNAYA